MAGCPHFTKRWPSRRAVTISASKLESKGIGLVKLAYLMWWRVGFAKAARQKHYSSMISQAIPGLLTVDGSIQRSIVSIQLPLRICDRLSHSAFKAE
jgi:hypothetical protein